MVASVIPAVPSPCANAVETAASKKAACIRIFFFVILISLFMVQGVFIALHRLNKLFVVSDILVVVADPIRNRVFSSVRI